MWKEIFTLVLSMIVVCGSAPCIHAGNPEVEEYIKDLKSGTLEVRKNAVISLGEIKEKSALSSLIEALKDKESSVRWESAKALGNIKDPSAVIPLTVALKDENVNVRWYSAYALGEIKDPKAVEPLVMAMRDKDWLVRDYAGWALGEIKDPKAVEPLAGILKEKDADMDHIVWVLKKINDPKTVDLFIPCLKDKDEETRKKASYVLRGIKDPRATDALISALKDDSKDVRMNAANALLAIGDARASQPLKEMLVRDGTKEMKDAIGKDVAKLALEKGLIAYWNFDDENKKKATDVTGNADGEIKGGTYVKGKVGFGLELNGSEEYVEIGKPPLLNIVSKPLTLMAWVNSKAENGVVIGNGGAWSGFCLYIKDGVARMATHLVKDGPMFLACGKTKIVDSWAHIAGVIRQDCIEIYVNGMLEGSASTPGMPGPTGQGMEIGFDVANSAGEITDCFNGIIDEVKIYNYGLSAEEIAKQYTKVTGVSIEPKKETQKIKPAPTTPAKPKETKPVEKKISEGLVAHWNFDKDNGDLAEDISGNRNKGEIKGAVCVKGKFGNALEFNGEDNYVDCGDEDCLNVADEITIMAWIKPDDQLRTFPIIVDKGDQKEGRYIFRLDQERYLYGIFWAESKSVALIKSDKPISKEWHYVAVTYDPSNTGKLRLYIDAVMKEISDTDKWGDTSGTPLIISGPGQKAFKGIIDEVRIYNRTLSPDEILAIYKSGGK